MMMLEIRPATFLKQFLKVSKSLDLTSSSLSRVVICIMAIIWIVGCSAGETAAWGCEKRKKGGLKRSEDPDHPKKDLRSIKIYQDLSR